MMLQRKPKHRALMLTEDHQIVDVNLDVDVGSIAEERSGRAWGLVPGAVIPRYGSRTPYLVICGRCDGPFNARRNKWEVFDKDEVNRIAGQCLDKEINELPKRAIQEKAASMLRLTIAALALCVGVMSMVVLVSSGQIRIPGL